MIDDLVRGVRFAVVTLAIVSGGYPLAIWAVGQVAFPRQANGSLLTRADGTTVGSALIAQSFTGDRYFQPRPSAVDYNAASTGGSNLGPTNPDHLHAVRGRVAAVRQREGLGAAAVPADLVTTSGAGLDPHLSPEAIDVQVARVAAARGVGAQTIRQLVAGHLEPATFGLLGRPRVNVLQLNLALDAAFPSAPFTRTEKRP